MTIRWLFAALHLLALGIGVGGVWARSRALAGPLDAAGLRRAFVADNWWGIATVVWIGTGLARLFALEKGAGYYAHNLLFQAKMGVFVLIFLLELRPMITLLKWRRVVRHGAFPDTGPAQLFARTSAIQAVLIGLMVLAATGMARGYGTR